ncbi:MAG: response regulator transcription factor [Smithella sp.]
MIKLAVVTHDEKYLQQLINHLHREKDISLLSTIIIKDFDSEEEQFLAFMNQMIEQKPDVFLFEQAILRDVVAVNLEKILYYKDELPTMKTIIIGIRFNEENVMAMMLGGVRGFFRFAQGVDLLIKCIRLVARGEIWLEAEMTTLVFEEVFKKFRQRRDVIQPLTELDSAKLDTLTSREMEILELISHSMTNEEIADKLFISSKTVKTHLRNIFLKADIKNRVEAALLYTRHALMPR